MSARGTLGSLALVLLSGCGASFTMSGPAQYHVPATRAATLLGASATTPKFVAVTKGTELTEARVMGAGILLDYTTSTTTDFAVQRLCGPLTMIDGMSGAAMWTRERKGACPHAVLPVTSALITFEESATKDGKTTSIARLDATTGQPRATFNAPGVASATLLGDDLLTLEGAATARAVVLRAGDTLTPRWSLRLTEAEAARTLVAGAGVVHAVGVKGVLTVDARTGQRLGMAAIPSKQPLTPLPYEGGLLVTAPVADGDKPAVSALGPNGALRWTVKGVAAGVVEGENALLVSDQEIRLVNVTDGKERWRAKLAAVISGRPAMATADGLVLVPHRKGVTAFDAGSGAPRFTVDARPGEPLARHLDQLFVERDGLVILDTWRHVIAFDLTGKVRYALPVRSVPLNHRESRSALANAKSPIANQKFESAALMSSMFSPSPAVHGITTVDGKISSGALGLNGAIAVGTVQMHAAVQDAVAAMGQANANAMNSAIDARRQAQFLVAIRQSAAAADSPFVVRAISWNVGRGFLVVRKSDGAFTEVVTGPSDIYEDMFRESSLGVLHPSGRMLLTLSEGAAAKDWKRAPVTLPVQLVERRLMGFAVDPDAFHPATEYATTSKVPDGSFTWLEDLAVAEKRLVGQ